MYCSGPAENKNRKLMYDHLHIFIILLGYKDQKNADKDNSLLNISALFVYKI